MQIIISVNKVPIRLTQERWQHIIAQHPEMTPIREYVFQTVSQPDLILQGDFGELLALRFYTETPLTSKYTVVAYKEISSDDGFILTAYLANKPSVRRTIVWKQ